MGCRVAFPPVPASPLGGELLEAGQHLARPRGYAASAERTSSGRQAVLASVHQSGVQALRAGWEQGR